MSEALTWMPATEIRDLVVKADVSAVEVLDHFLGRIEEHNEILKAFEVVDREGAHAQAEAADRAVASGEEVGPLHGIPMSVKSHIPIKGFPVRALGSSASVPASRDDISVERLRAAGAVIVGTNTMMYSGAKRPEGPPQPWVYPPFNWEAEARNPWDPAKAPGFSSSGGAAAAAARLLPITLGSDGGGSTRLPAAYSGVVGLHPSPKLIPNANFEAPAIASMIVSYGPLARYVVDAAVALQAMAGPDGRDFTVTQHDPDDYLASIDAGVEGLRLAWTDDFGFTDMYALEESRRVVAQVRDQAFKLADLGATVEKIGEVWEDYFIGNTDTKFLWGMAPKPEREAYGAALDTRQHNWKAFRKVFGEYDVILSVTSQLIARDIEDWDACWHAPKGVFRAHGSFAPVYCSHTMLTNWLGFPSFSVPCGFLDGMPISLQIIGWPDSEAKLFRVAQAFQKYFGPMDKPRVS